MISWRSSQSFSFSSGVDSSRGHFGRNFDFMISDHLGQRFFFRSRVKSSPGRLEPTFGWNARRKISLCTRVKILTNDSLSVSNTVPSLSHSASNAISSVARGARLQGGCCNFRRNRGYNSLLNSLRKSSSSKDIAGVILFSVEKRLAGCSRMSGGT